MRRREPVFNLVPPLLFAHRGGAGEAPECTAMAFNHAVKNAEADVLELDIQLTKCGEFVVWHGPELSNVRIEGQSDTPMKRRRNKIYDYRWHELDGKAWVADPGAIEKDGKNADLSTVAREEDRCLLTLSSLLEKFPDSPLNIDMKRSFENRIDEAGRTGLRDNIRAFIKVLNNDPGRRKILVVSAVDEFLSQFRNLAGSQFLTGLSAREQLLLRFFDFNLKSRALETSHHRFISGRRIIEKVRESGGSTFVFLTGYGSLLPAIDEKNTSERKVFKILARGVDGIMTDRPRKLRGILNKWRKQEMRQPPCCFHNKRL